VSASSSLGEVIAAFSAAGEPTLQHLAGRHRATRCGPLWMRGPAPLFLAATGMPGWWGKQFAAPAPGATTIDGHNLVRRDGDVVPSLPMSARLGASRVDGRPALLLTYPPDARRPWRHVTDEVRPTEHDVLLGLSFDILPQVPVAVPFLLTRV
jgi:hypothetical protein